MNKTPILHEIFSVTETEDPVIYLLSVDLTDIHGERYITDYVSSPSDTFGLAPTIRTALEDWITSEKPIEPYQPPALEEIKTDLKVQVVRYADELGSMFTAGYPDSERQSWPQKHMEAKLIAAGETNPEKFPVIAAEADITDIDPVEISGWILSRAAIFEKAAGIISGFRQIAIIGIDEAGTTEAAQTALDNAKTLAVQKLATLTS